MGDIVISTINEKAGGGTKYINWRDRDFLPAAIQKENYRKNLTAPINDYVDGHPTYKYASITDMIYKAVFHENAKRYKELLKLEPKDNAKATIYAEVLRVISSFENGVGSAIRDLSVRLHRKISIQEVQTLINDQAESPVMSPFLYEARLNPIIYYKVKRITFKEINDRWLRTNPFKEYGNETKKYYSRYFR